IDDKEAIGNTYGQLGRLYSKRKEYEKALKFLYAARDKFRFIQSPCLDSIEGDIADIKNQLGKEQFEKLLKKAIR
ncbi:MAG: hypothetical protein HXS48_02705, partial [Theionarchaea archaeon]|nr:hypothetical protein [Theionarchaea archaeon]